MKIQNEISTFDKKINNIISNRIKYNKDNHSSIRQIKKENKKTKKKIGYFNIIFIIKFLIIINFYKKSKSNRLFFHDSKITLKINADQIKDYYILGTNFQGINHLKEVYINNKTQNDIKNIYPFTKGDNNVTMG